MKVRIHHRHIDFYGLPDIVYNVDDNIDYHGFHRILDGAYKDWNINHAHILKEPTPYFKHDCDKCTYLGSIIFANDEKFDLYHCRQGVGAPTTIARFGEGGDYVSGVEFGKRNFERPEHVKAETTWQAHGIAFYISKCLGLDTRESFKIGD